MCNKDYKEEEEEKYLKIMFEFEGTIEYIIVTVLLLLIAIGTITHYLAENTDGSESNIDSCSSASISSCE